MKKIILIGLSLAISATLFAQQNKDGKMNNEILYLNSGIMLKKGSALKLNGPLGEDSHFKYIHHAPDNLFDDAKATLNRPVEPYYATRTLTVKKIRYVGDKKDGSEGRWIVRLRTEGKNDFICDIMDALNSGELSAIQMVDIIPVQPQQVQPAQAPSQQLTAPAVTETAQPESKAATPVASVADELLKLKKLMDEGILTKEEFEAQKKKLLDL